MNLVPAVAKWHKELFGARNQNFTSLQHKFNAIANMTPPTGDPNILGSVLLDKDAMWKIEIRMDQGRLVLET